METSGRPDLAATYRAHATALTRFATALVGPTEAQDVVADAVVTLLASGKLEEASNPRPLLYRAVLARARSTQRTFARRRAREERVASSLSTFDPEIRPEVAAAVGGLSPQQRACVFLAYWEDLTHAGIADRLGLSEGTVKRYLARARSRLQETLREH